MTFKIKLILSVAFVLLTGSANSQTYSSWIKKADSLSNIEDYKGAWESYEEAVKIIFEDKEQVAQETWDFDLKRAGDVAAKVMPFKAAVKFRNLAKGNTGEKLKDQIDLLQFLGVKNQIVYTPVYYEKSFSSIINECSPNETKYLLWWHQGKCFIQKFTECNTYPTIEIISKIKPIVLNLNKFKNEEISPVVADGSHNEKYILDFYRPGSNFSKEIEGGNINSKNTHINTSPIYHKNRNTNLYALLNGLIESVKNYETILTSGKERKKRGEL